MASVVESQLQPPVDSQDKSSLEEIYGFFPGIVYVYNPDTKKLHLVNKTKADILGFSIEDINNLDGDFTRIVYREDVELVREELEKFNELKDTECYSYQWRFSHKNGDAMHFQVAGRILRRDGNGRVASVLLMAQNIHDHIRSVEDLRLLRELAEDNEALLQFGNWNWNPRTDTLVWSSGMYALMDFDIEADTPVITLDTYQRCIVGAHEPLKEIFKKAVLNCDKMVEYEHRVITGRQREKTLYSKGKVFYNNQGEVTKIFGITRDITEPARVIDNLDNYRRMVMEKEDFLGQGSWEWDLQHNTAVWSDGMYRLFGYDPLDDKQRVTVDEDLYELHLDSDAFGKARANLKETLKNGSTTYVWGYDIKTKEGETRMLESFGKIIRDSKGRGIKVLGSTRDVSLLRKYELDLARKNSELLRLGLELEDSAYAASHDLQEPLRKISTLSDRLKDKFNGVLPEDGKKYIDRIQVATKNARSLIDSLMEFSRITHENQTFKATELNELLKEVIADLELKIEETHTTIFFGQLPTLEVSPLLIKQLFSNILLNSIKFRKENVYPVIDIQCRTLERIEMQDHPLDPGVPYFLITIKDNGIGFEEMYASKIFQMFSRLHGKSEYPGSGIGLALCKKIVDNHHGHIFATGVPDQGATFSIILPKKHS